MNGIGLGHSPHIWLYYSGVNRRPPQVALIIALAETIPIKITDTISSS
jgi:hypothetical protein